MDGITQGDRFQVDDLDYGGNGHLSAATMERSSSINTIRFRSNYEAMLKEVLEENSEDESEDLLSNIDIDVNAATAELPEDLRAALEDRSLGDKYLANLKTFMSHQRTHSLGSAASAKGDFSSPNTPMQASFSHQSLQPKPLFRLHHDPLLKILDAVPYHTRLVNGVQSLTVLEQKFHALRIPELDLPTISDTIIRSRLDDLYKIQDELYIHLHGGPLVRNTHMSHNIGEKKKAKIVNFLDEVAKEIGLYEEFVKRANYLSLENILNESDDSSNDGYQEDVDMFDTDTSLHHFDSSSDISRVTPGTPVSPATFSPTTSGVSPKTLRRITSQSLLPSPSSEHLRHTNGVTHSRMASPTSDLASETGTDQSPAVSLLVGDDQSISQQENVEPWEAFHWAPLKKISNHLYSDEVKRQSGLVSVLAVSGVIAIGTTRGLVFVYDYKQNLKCVVGDSARAIEVGSVTSLAISADHTTLAVGHSQGYIVVWDINKPAQPVRTIEPILASQVLGPSGIAAAQQQSRKEGHVKGASILHIGFVGVKRSEIVSGDDQGMAFYHVLYKVVMVNAVDTTRILGRYQNLTAPLQDTTNNWARGNGDHSSPIPPKLRRPSTVFAMQPLPLGQIPHLAENFGLIALLTPYKMIIVGLKPTPQTQFKFLKPKAQSVSSSTADNNGLLDENPQRDESFANRPVESLAGCLAWLPVTRSGSADHKTPKPKNCPPFADPMLAFSWGNHLFILTVGVEDPETTRQAQIGRSKKSTPSTKSKRGTKLDFIKCGEWKCRDPIVGLQWINKQILVLITPSEEMILFDPKNMVETERVSIRNKQLVYHDQFNAPLRDLTLEPTVPDTQQPNLSVNDALVPLKVVEMAYYHSLRGYKSRMFLLGLNTLYVGSLLSWADRIIALVRAGDFLEGIELATLFYNGNYMQTVLGLPEDEHARKQLVGEKLMELLIASLNYAFSSKRTFDGMLDDVDGGNVLFESLAIGCINACLSMNNLEFLFNVVYDRFASSHVKGIFLEVLEPYILEDQMTSIPPDVMKDLVDHYVAKRRLKEMEQIIWHVDPQCLDIDQIVSVCHREGLYEAMMYVWNRSMDDYVSPVVEMLKVIRTVLKQEQTRLSSFRLHPYSYENTGRDRLPSAGSEQMPNDPEMDIRRNAEKLFDYFKCILTGRTFPDGAQMPTSKANEARSAVYAFVFSGRCVMWPRVDGKLVLTADDEEETSEPTYPYLRLLLRFNTEKLLQALEIAFEDPWLNGGDDLLTTTHEEEASGKVISRQIIVNTLLDILGGGVTGNALPLPPPRPKQSISTSTVLSLSHIASPINKPTDPPVSENDGVIQLYIFIALNLHKYTTFILLPPTTLFKILVCLSEDRNPETRKVRQRAVQNLLTIYTPINEEHMVLYYEDAGFYQVLEDVYRREKKYSKLIETYLNDDEQRDMVFSCVYELLDDRSPLNEKKRNEVKNVFFIRLSQFVEINGQKTAQVVEDFFQGDHDKAIRRLEEDQEFDDEEYQDTADKRVFLYLQGLLEPLNEEQDDPKYQEPYMQQRMHHVDPAIQERYIELMCRFDPSGVYNYLNTRVSGEINLSAVLKSCEENGVIDAVVWIMEKNGDARGALDKMLAVAKEKIALILDIIRYHSASADNVDQSQDNSLQEPRQPRGNWTFEEQGMISSSLIGLSGVLRVGTRLCENSSRALTHEDDNEQVENDEIESLWFRLLDAYVESSIEIYNALNTAKHASDECRMPEGLRQHIVSSFKSFVQSILTSLLLSTSPQISLPRLLLRLIQSQARGETTFADFRDIFLSMLDTYKYEGKLLEMTNRLFERDLFGGVHDLVRGKSRGWRPKTVVCDICGNSVLDMNLIRPPLAWDKDDDESQDNNQPEASDKHSSGSQEQDATVEIPQEQAPEKDVVVFRCKHIYHKHCLAQRSNSHAEGQPWRCVACLGGETTPETTQPNNSDVEEPVKEPSARKKGKERAP